jgi:triacylglycerol lipase
MLFARSRAPVASFRPSLVFALLFGWAFLCPLPTVASNRFSGEPKQVFAGPAALPWARVELLEDPHPQFGTDAFAPGTRIPSPSIARWFGSATPKTSQVLLHCVKGWDGRTLPRPVLLIHGAGDNANRAWMFPHEPPTDPSIEPAKEKWGHANWLASMGYAVFAVSFAHNQGCNIRQAEQIANAITRIRRLLKRESDPSFKIDLIAHSKGNIAARLYCSDAAAVFPTRRWLTPFRRDVHTYISIAGPLQGIDTPFRYYGFNLLNATDGDATRNAPMAASRMLLYGKWQDFSHHSYDGGGSDLWAGQAQALYNLARDGKVPLGADSFTAADGGWTTNALYNGGVSGVLRSPGIDAAIARGERLMYRLEERGLDPSVRFAFILGTNPVLQSEYMKPSTKALFFSMGMFQAAFSAPTDGAVFVDAGRDTTGILRRGARLVGKQLLPMHHMELACHRDVVKILDQWLMKP